MKLLRLFSVIFLSILLLDPMIAKADAEPTAPSVTLHTTCTEAGNPIPNCFTTVADLFGWVMSTRKPNANAPLAIQIGSGTFPFGLEVTLQCSPSAGFTGHMAFIGKGRSASILLGSLGGSEAALNFTNCTEMSFSELKIKWPTAGLGIGYIAWVGGGRSTWRSVDIEAAGMAWYEITCGTQKGEHYWFGSRITSVVRSNPGTYYAQCDESWIIGSEVAMLPGTGFETPGRAVIAATKLGASATIHVYGGVLRWLASYSGGAATADIGGSIHIHGTGIDVLPSQGNATVLRANGAGSMIHANASSYNLSAGPGKTVTRIKVENGGHVHAPYLWEHIPDPATVPNFTSVNGADMTTVTSGTSDGQPHLVIYSTNCTSKWYDAVDKVCLP